MEYERYERVEEEIVDEKRNQGNQVAASVARHSRLTNRNLPARTAFSALTSTMRKGSPKLGRNDTR